MLSWLAALRGVPFIAAAAAIFVLVALTVRLVWRMLDRS
jgi:hypothetical protein